MVEMPHGVDFSFSFLFFSLSLVQDTLSAHRRLSIELDGHSMVEAPHGIDFYFYFPFLLIELDTGTVVTGPQEGMPKWKALGFGV